MRISEKQLRAAVLAYHGDDFFDCFEEGSEFANEKVEAIRAALEAAQSAAGTATEIDEAARYLRETLQSGKNLKPWAVTDKGTKRKWLKLAQGTIEAALSAQVQDVAERGPKEIATWEDQQAFEEWAQGERYEMHQHPLHYLFMDPKTNAARQGWKAALQFIRDRSAAAPAKQESGHD